MVEYRGFRIQCVSVLPISSDTVCYGTCKLCRMMSTGSSDGGHTVKKTDPVLNDLMKELGRKLNLAPHTVANEEVYTCGDLEGHKGKVGWFVEWE